MARKKQYLCGFLCKDGHPCQNPVEHDEDRCWRPTHKISAAVASKGSYSHGAETLSPVSRVTFSKVLAIKRKKALLLRAISAVSLVATILPMLRVDPKDRADYSHAPEPLKSGLDWPPEVERISNSGWKHILNGHAPGSLIANKTPFLAHENIAELIYQTVCYGQKEEVPRKGLLKKKRYYTKTIKGRKFRVVAVYDSYENKWKIYTAHPVL